MAAITPHLEEVNDPSESQAEKEYFGDSPTHGLGRLEFEKEPLAEAVVESAHAELLSTVWTRRAIEEALEGRTITIETHGRNVVLVLDEPLGATPRFNPPGSGTAQNFKLLAWTKKMGCPSFSLPAGPVEFGGACPGAAGGQSIVPRTKLLAAQKLVRKVTQQPVNLASCVCQSCLTGDTRVLVKGRGVVRLDEIEEGETVTVWAGDGWYQTHLIARGVRDVVEVETSWGIRLRMTSDHEMLSEGEMVPVEDLDEGARLDSQPPQKTPFPSAAPLPAVSVSTHDNALRYTLPTQWSYDVGRFLGHVIGNGAVSHGKYPTIVIGADADDKADLDALVTIAKQWSSTETEVKVHTPKPARPDSLVPTRTPKPQAQLSLRATGIAAFLFALGLDKQSPPEARRVPSTIWTASEAGVRGFLAGLFGTDGSVSAAPTKVEVSFAQASRGFVEDTQQLLFAFGIRSTICEYRSNAARGYLPLYKLSISADAQVRRFAEIIGFASARKQARLESALAQLDPRRPRPSYPRIRSVTPCDKPEPVYDLVDVGPDHRFSANGLTVSNCYATGGNYRYGSKQLTQVVVLAWTRQAVKDGSFVEVMDWAVKNANYHLDASSIDGTSYPPEHRGLFFRIHDSGDFFSREYLAAWKAVADANPDVTFWAPTRVWATSWGIRAVNEINRNPRNLILRPSSYEVNSPALEGLGPGWASWSVVYAKAVKPPGGPMHASGPFNWDCQAYAAEAEAHSCRHALAPDGATGCRACWLHPELSVNYTLH